MNLALCDHALAIEEGMRELIAAAERMKVFVYFSSSMGALKRAFLDRLSLSRATSGCTAKTSTPNIFRGCKVSVV